MKSSKDLHEHPELPHHEHRTARRVAGQLQNTGVKLARSQGSAASGSRG